MVRAPKRKRWTFPAACAFVQAHAALNPAGAARLLTWAIRRVSPDEGWRSSQTRIAYEARPLVDALAAMGPL